jgi:hypothetical protein
LRKVSTQNDAPEPRVAFGREHRRSPLVARKAVKDSIDARHPLVDPHIERIYAIIEQQRREHQLKSLCDIVSDELRRRFGWALEEGEYRGPEVAAESERSTSPYWHAWNRLADGTVVDATANQFGDSDPIRVILPDDPRQQHYRKEPDFKPAFTNAIL